MPYTQVSNLDFEQIKVSLKEYMRSQSEFTDYDFEGSALATLIDTLAYNTYYTAFNTNMVVNELFIDSATLRDNVVSIAKQLGYRPKSITAPTAYISFSINYTNATTDKELVLQPGTGFVASYDNNIYSYIVNDAVTGQVVNNVATFENVEIKEGTRLVNTFTINSAIKSQRFILDNQDIDTNTIRVQVYPGGGSFNVNQSSDVTITLDATGSGTGSTNLSWANRTATTGDVTSDTGTNATLTLDNNSLAGLISASDKVALGNAASTSDLSNYLTISNAASTYQTIAGMSSYYTKTESDNKFLVKDFSTLPLLP